MRAGRAWVAQAREWLDPMWADIARARTLGLAAEMSFWLFLSLVPLAAVAGLAAQNAIELIIDALFAVGADEFFVGAGAWRRGIGSAGAVEIQTGRDAMSLDRAKTRIVDQSRHFTKILIVRTLGD